MTPNGNHGGGTVDESNAALFVHTWNGCLDMFDSALFLEQTSSAFSKKSSNVQLPAEWMLPTKELFTAIHQIDLVPTIAILLGLPIPYANLGGLVPSIVPGLQIRHMVTALALNAAKLRTINLHLPPYLNPSQSSHAVMNVTS
jgi:phosphatidylinositol glycan class O